MNGRGERGSALVMAMMAVFLMGAIAASLAILSNTELRIAANGVEAAELRYTAEAALELALEELGAISDWESVLASGVLSTLADGPAGGQRTLGDGSAIDLDDLSAQAVADNPTFRLFAFAPAGRLQEGEDVGRGRYVAVWLGEDGEDEPATLVMRAEALGASGMRRMLAARVRRTAAGGVEVVSWQELP
jgi:hypothetical protein